MQYKAFISYSHAADGKLAPLLQSALQRFAKPWYRLRALRVFRDATGLSATPALWPAIEKALTESEHFLLMASPRAAQSPWVAREIQWWLDHRSPDRLLVLLTDGELAWDDAAQDFDWRRTTALAPVLQGRFADEPLYVDLRWAQEADDLSLRHSQFRRAVLDLAAPLHGRPKDELDGEDVRQHRRTRRLAATAIVVLAALTLATGGAAWYAVGQSRIAKERQVEAEEARDAEEVQRKQAEASERAAMEERDRADLKQKEAERERRNAEQQTRIAVAERTVARHQARVALSNQRSIQSRSALREGTSIRALLLAAEAVQVSLRAGDPRVPAAEEALWQALAHTGGRALGGEPSPAGKVAMSPDARWAVTARWDGTVQLWDLEAADPGAHPRRLSGHHNTIRAVVFSRDGRWLATAGDDRTARLWDLTTPGPRSIVLQGHEGPVKALAISPDGHWAATGSDDKTARLWDLTSADPATPARVLRGHDYEVDQLAFSPDSRLLVTASRDSTPRLWDLTAGASSPVVLAGHDTSIDEVAFSPNGRWLASGDAKGTARLWDLKAASIPASSRVLAGHRRAVLTLRFSPDGRWLASGGGDPDVRLWDLEAADPAAVAPILLPSGQEDDGTVAMTRLEFSPHGRWLATQGDEVSEAARLWDLRAATPRPKLIRLPATGAGSAQRIAFGGGASTDERLVVSSSDAVRAWTLRGDGPFEAPAVLHGHDYLADEAALSGDGRWLVTAAAGEPVARLWDLTAPGAATNRVLGRSSALIRHLLVRPDGRFLAGLPDRSAAVEIWDLQARDPALSRSSVSHAEEITAAAFTGDGRWLATASQDGTVGLWDLQGRPRGKPTVSLRTGSVTCLAPSPDGRWLATAGADALLRLWDLHARNPAAAPFVLRGHRERINALAFSRDSRWLVSAGEDPTARLWDLRSGRPAASPKVLDGGQGAPLLSVEAMAFSPDGRWLAPKLHYGLRLLWHLGTPGGKPALLPLKHDATYPWSGVTFSPAGRWMAASDGTVVELWDLTSLRPGAGKAIELKGQNEIEQMAFSPDGRRLATATSKDVRLWDLTAESSLRPSSTSLIGHDEGVLALAFARGGRWLATSGVDRTVRLWDLDPKELTARACRVAGRNLLPQEWERYFPGEPYRKTCPD